VPGAYYQNSRAKTATIVGNSFSAQVPVLKPTRDFPLSMYYITLELEGIFVSPSKLEGTFKSKEDNGWQTAGQWTAAPSQSK
jgi:hypothetical protein